jgi:glucans biosynthesis protein
MPRLFPALVVMLVALAPGVSGAFGFGDVEKRARELAVKPYVKPGFSLPRELKELNYDQVRDIRYHPSKALWRKEGLPFEVQFFHLGRFFDLPVRLHEIVGGQVREIEFDPADFDYGKNSIPPMATRGLGFAGFRVHYALNTPKYKDEVVVFLGASYFRALGKGQRYGVSARGLAIDTAETSGEEFPRFEEFWLERPAKNARELTVYALLSSRRMTGAYKFAVRPGTSTVTEVQARLFAREAGAKVGIAPLTTMYFYGENQRGPSEDFRPEVHDSDGLSIASASGEWIWRPLSNPRRLLVTSFEVTRPRGFGLMQRDREFRSYEDLEARYDLRPSAWVEPVGEWGTGRVELVQIPTKDETNDNVVAYWVPREGPKPGTAFAIAYRVAWQRDNEMRPPTSWVTQTRRGHGFQTAGEDTIQFTVDFEGPAIAKLAEDDEDPLTADFNAGSNGQTLEVVTHKHDVTGGWRMTAKVKRVDKDKPIELRAQLKHAGQPVSETWSYIVPPQ